MKLTTKVDKNFVSPNRRCPKH